MTKYRVELTGTWRYIDDVEASDEQQAYDIIYGAFLDNPNPDVTLDFDNFNYNVEKL